MSEKNRGEGEQRHEASIVSSRSSSAQPHLFRLGPVDLFSWDPIRAAEGASFGTTARNLGDTLGRRLVEMIVARRGLDVDSAPGHQTSESTLLAVGSILHFAPHGATIWGSGVNYKVPSRLTRSAQTLDVRAVRGPITARVLERAGCEVPAVYGDPILLLPLFFPDVARWKALGGSEVLVVPNLNDYLVVHGEAVALGLDVADPTAPTDHLLKRIASAKFVVGSSLHAVVIADSLGIPARFVVSRNEHALKYRDYLAGTGRAGTRIASTIQEAVKIGPHRKPDFSVEALMDAFPDDLWRPGSVRTVSRRPGSRGASERWDSLIDARESSEIERVSTDEMRTSLVALRDAANATLARLGVTDSDDGSVRGRLRSSFETACSVRETAGSFTVTAELTDSDLDLLTAVELGHEELALRSVWLSRVGPHAIARSFTFGSALESILLLSLRPGRLVNEIESWRLCRAVGDGLEVIAELPVFAVHRRQWSIDASVALSVGIADGSTSNDLFVQYREAASEWTALRVDQAEHGVDRLSGYPLPDGDGLIEGSEMRD